MKIIIVRHGETIENKEGIVQGHLHGTLSELGKEQAKNTAKILKDEKIDFIYSSDLKRAVDTTKEISKLHPNVPIKFTQELRERYLGKFQGKKKVDLGLNKDQGITHSNEKDIETFEEMLERAKNLVKKILIHNKNDTILFITHNGMAQALECAIKNKKANEIPKVKLLEHHEIRKYNIKWQI